MINAISRMILRSVALGIVVLTACSPAGSRLAGSNVATLSNVPNVPSVGHAVAATIESAPLDPGERTTAPGRSIVSLSVRWPARSVAALPSSANAVSYEIDLGNQTPAMTGTISRTAGVLVSSRSFEIDPTPLLTVTAKAYADNPPKLNSIVLAQGTATASVAPNTRVSLKLALSLTTEAEPKVASFTPNNGGPDASVTFTVSNVPSLATLFLRLGQATASVSRPSASTLTTNVPAGAVSAPWAFFADGLPATPTATFSVLKAIAFGDATDSMKQNSAFQFTAVATTSENTSFTIPAVKWLVFPAPASGQSTAAVSVTPPSVSETGGVFASSQTSTGDFVILMRTGTLEATRALKILQGSAVATSSPPP
ncbi:MAG: hypothetical protein FJZ00_01520 [Candidatus Sericytochromatia bacterium]|uniref:CHRD domain-containing protein n=1 Tax=Candidatus Tanganyikabacteria bacterium TaxID=2961651 RepID=A0A937X2V7_9BACT|nr:hypothetical protein [Candidatus Tanganyikabacteria bacterium]